MSNTAFECVVKAASADMQIVAVQVVNGRFAIDDELTCVETGRRYRIISFGLTSYEAYAAGIEVLSLEILDELPVEGALVKGMHLIGQ